MGGTWQDRVGLRVVIFARQMMSRVVIFVRQMMSLSCGRVVSWAYELIIVKGA